MNIQRTRCPLTRSKWLSILLETPSISRARRFHSNLQEAEKGCFLSLRHQGIYGFRRSALLQFVKWKPTPLERAESLEQLRALENGVKVHVLITAKGSPGIDTPADAEALEQKLARAERRTSR